MSLQALSTHTRNVAVSDVSTDNLNQERAPFLHRPSEGRNKLIRIKDAYTRDPMPTRQRDPVQSRFH